MQVCIPIRGATWPSKIALSVAVVMAVSISLLHLPATEKAQSSFSWFLWEYSASPCIFSYVCSFNQYLSENWIVVCTMLSTVDTVLPICNLHKSSLFLGENPFSLGVGNNSFHSVTITAPGLVNSMLSYIYVSYTTYQILSDINIIKGTLKLKCTSGDQCRGVWFNIICFKEMSVFM